MIYRYQPVNLAMELRVQLDVVAKHVMKLNKLLKKKDSTSTQLVLSNVMIPASMRTMV